MSSSKTGNSVLKTSNSAVTASEVKSLIITVLDMIKRPISKENKYILSMVHDDLMRVYVDLNK